MMKHSISIKLNDSDFDNNKNLIPSRVLSFFQKGADEHAKMLGVGFDDMFSKNLLWVVTQIKYEVVNGADSDEEVTIVTWPLPPTRAGFQREYLIKNKNGETLIKGTSNWALIDTVNRRLTTEENIYPEGEHCLDKNFEKRIKRIRDFEGDGTVFDICPDKSLIDRNGHVNNTNYANFVMTALKDTKSSIHTFQIDYVHEIMCEQNVFIHKAQSDKGLLVKGMDKDNTLMFTSCVTLK